MAERRVEVEVSGTIVMFIDDEAVSDWDGSTLLTCHENPERFQPGSTLATALAGAAVSVGLWNSHDGWADFPDEAIRSFGMFDFPDINGVTIDGERVS